MENFHHYHFLLKQWKFTCETWLFKNKPRILKPQREVPHRNKFIPGFSVIGFSAAACKAPAKDIGIRWNFSLLLSSKRILAYLRHCCGKAAAVTEPWFLTGIGICFWIVWKQF